MNDYNQCSDQTIYSIAEEAISHQNTDELLSLLQSDLSNSQKKVILAAISDNQYPLNNTLFNFLLQLKKEKEFEFMIMLIVTKCRISYE